MEIKILVWAYHGFTESLDYFIYTYAEETPFDGADNIKSGFFCIDTRPRWGF